MKISISYIRLFILLSCGLVLFNQCQFKIENYEQSEKLRFPVINADLTETYARVSVELSYDDPKLYNTVKPKPLPNTTAYIESGKGERFQVSIDGSISNNFKGQAGEKYKLVVFIADKKYESSFETMPVTTTLDSVSYAYNVNEGLVDDDYYKYGFDIFAYSKDNDKVENYYQWDWIHYEKLSYCETLLDRTIGAPALTACNGDCWGITYNDRITILSDKLINGKSIVQKVFRVPYLNQPSKYYLKVEQRNITKSAYDYFQSIDVQNRQNGTLFDVPAQTLFSPNIKSVADPNEKVLGIFNVYSSSFKVIYIDLSQNIPGATRRVVKLGFPIHSDPLAGSPCIEGTYKTKIKPVGWID